MAAKVGFLGAGMMAEAMMKGFVAADLVSNADVSACDVTPQRRDAMKQLGIATMANADVVKASKIVFVAVKPQYVATVLTEAAAAIDETEHIVVSIAAGVTISAIEKTLAEAGKPKTKVIRVMPNTPCFVGASAAGMSLGSHATGADGALVERFMSAVGQCHTVGENLLDAVTGLSGSGPAYVFLTIEAMADGGVAAGLPRPVALALAAQTVMGAAKMVVETGTHPGVLKDQVCSPGGTTIAGVHELEKAGIRAAFMNAVTAAANRSRELGRPAKL